MRTAQSKPRWSMLFASLVVAGGAGCGGGGGGGGAAPQGMVLVDFIQAGQDNVPLNRVLEFVFSDAIDPTSVGPSSLQIREGPSFGAAIFGKYIIQGDRVFFEPALPGLCDGSDGGLKANTDYRVVIVGAPEDFAIKSVSGDPLQSTVTAGLTFHTRSDTDPELFEDQRPGQLPFVVSTSPADGSANVGVGSTNRVEITFSENLDPCTVNEGSVLFQQYAVGPFAPVDATPSDPLTWGSGTPTAPPRRVRCTYTLAQDRLLTKLTLSPIFGEFPDNALLVVTMTTAVRDFGGNPLVPRSVSFTTEDRAVQTKSLVFEFDGDVPIDANSTTADVDTARAEGRVQGYLLISGDGDNGPSGNLTSGSGPDATRGPPGCVATFGAVLNDGFPDDFDPDVDVLLSTGNTRNTCTNGTDGSTAVTFEYRTFRIRNGVTVRVTGVNAAIILVRGDVNVDAGGRLLVRSDGQGGGPSTGQGGNGNRSTGASITPATGGFGVAGGGGGGRGLGTTSNTVTYGENGTAGAGSPDAFLAPGTGGAATPVRQGAGRGAVGTFANGYPGNLGFTNRVCPGGGGGGHAAAGTAGSNTGQGNTPFGHMDPFIDGNPGGTYGDVGGSMPVAEGGSGGGAGGPSCEVPFWTGSSSLSATGGGGGAGGGFVDLTTQASIRVFGTIDAAGSRGGNGVAGNGTGGFSGAGGGGGGGSGGGIRLLTPGSITFGAGAVLTAAGGAGGTSPAYVVAPSTATANPGGPGGVGRIVLEDGDSVITGFAGAALTPTEGATGFYRGVFDPSRFQGGGLRPVAITELIDVGPFSPSYVPPVAADFVAGIPASASRGSGNTSIFIEAEGFAANPDGTPAAVGTGWKSVGYFVDSGSELVPTWVPNATPPPGDVTILPGNGGGSIVDLDGNEFVRLRITFFLPSTVGPFDPGPYIDRWTLRFSYDQ
jgi:hypothetical protein